MASDKCSLAVCRLTVDLAEFLPSWKLPQVDRPWGIHDQRIWLLVTHPSCIAGRCVKGCTATGLAASEAASEACGSQGQPQVLLVLCGCMSGLAASNLM